MKQEAVIVKCDPDEGEHMLQDNCLRCAPFWYLIPTCPTHRRKLQSSGFCKDCRKYYDTNVGERRRCYRLGCGNNGVHRITDIKSLSFGEYACDDHKK